MLDTLKTAIDISDKGATAGDRFYHALASLSAIVVVMAFVTGDRPSDLVSGFFATIGAGPLATWFADPPPFMSASSVGMEREILTAIACLLLWMIIRPAYLEAREGMYVGFHSAHLALSRSASTFWILLVSALQQGPNTLILKDLRIAFAFVLAALIFLFTTLFILSWALSAIRPARPAALDTPWPLSMFMKSLVGAIFFSAFALLAVAVMVPIVIVLWACERESTSLLEARRRRAASRL